MINKKSSLAYISIFFWPLIFYIPLSSGFIAMGNDFDLIYFSYKKYIFEFWQDGELPYWSPSEGAGFSLIYNPFAQFFYLPSWILFFICDFKGTLSLQDYLIYTLFGISIYSYGQYQWLKNLKISSNLNCLIITLIVPTTLIFSNFLRLPNAIQTFCWVPFLLLGINYSLNSRKYLKSFLLIFFSSLFIFTAGYPYFVIYIFIFSFFYFIFISFVYKNLNIKFLYNSLKCMLPVVSSLIISLPWLLGVFKILSFTQDRNINNYEHATEHKFDFIDILGSWIYPVISNTEGRYYFGVIFTFIVLVFLFELIKNKLIIDKKNKIILYFCGTIFFVITILSITDETFIFPFLWNNIEFIQNMRTWPRINILLVPTLSLIGLFALDHFLKNFEKNINDKKILINFNIILFSILSFQLYFYLTNSFDNYWFEWHQKRFLFAKETLVFPFSELVMLTDGRINILSTLIVIIFLNISFKNKTILNHKFRNYFFVFLILSISFEQFLNSNLQWSLNKWKTINSAIPYYAKKTFKENFFKPRNKTLVHGNNYFRDNAFTVNNFLNWGNEKHNKVYWEYFDKNGNEILNLDGEDYKYIYQFFGLDNEGKKFYFTDDILMSDVIDFVKESENFEKKNIKNFLINKINNNLIQVSFSSSESAWLTYIDNHDPYWKAYINNNEVEISLFKDTYKSIKFEAGYNVLIFKYEPFTL